MCVGVCTCASGSEHICEYIRVCICSYIMGACICIYTCVFRYFCVCVPTSACPSSPALLLTWAPCCNSLWVDCHHLQAHGCIGIWCNTHKLHARVTSNLIKIYMHTLHARVTCNLIKIYVHMLHARVTCNSIKIYVHTLHARVTCNIIKLYMHTLHAKVTCNILKIYVHMLHAKVTCNINKIDMHTLHAKVTCNILKACNSYRTHRTDFLQISSQ
jgi:hypothetical protein